MKRNFFSLVIIQVLCILIVLSFAGCSSKLGNTDGILTEDYEAVENVNISGEENIVEDNRKIIENIDISVQTKEFDKLIENLNKQIKKLGGYIENSEIYGREYNSNDKRYAEFKIRIPSDKSGKFTDFISSNSVVVSKSVSTEDVTLKYVDMESRVKVLEAEKPLWKSF